MAQQDHWSEQPPRFAVRESRASATRSGCRESRALSRRGGCRSALSLIWLKTVKRTVLPRSGKSSFFFRLLLHRLLDRVGDRNAFPAVINAEMRESTRGVCTPRSYQQNTVRRGVLLSLGTRVDCHTASNDPQAFRLTGSLSPARSRLTGSGFHSLFLFIKCGLGLCPRRQAGFFTSLVIARGWTIRPIAHTNPLNSRPNAAAATCDFFRPTPVRCW